MNGMTAFFRDSTVQIAFWGLVKIVVILFVIVLVSLALGRRKIKGP